MDEAPATDPKRPTTDAETGFVRRPMVRWFDPHQLVDTVSRVMASGLWNSYADSRELQALTPCDVYDRSQGDELWLDYVADLGDGFNSTYTIARLLAQPQLTLGDHATRRGSILVMGGDEVYPVPKRTEYVNRLIGPYRSALPCVPADEAGAGGPELFAIPGSHDWYDGLINFTNVFCRQRAIGGWRTRQSRSYYALKLPHGWWLWGVDLQFGDYLDEHQLQYFAAAAERLAPGDRIILAMAKEVSSGRKSEEVASDRDVSHLERALIEPAGARIPLYLKSGRHYYARYAEEGGPAQLITAGGGGAFMHPTHHLDEYADPHTRDDEHSYRLQAAYPSASQSKRLRKWLFVLPAYNLPLAGVFGAAYVLVAFMMNLHLHDAHRSIALGDLRQALWQSPTAFVLILLLILTFGGLVRLAHDASGWARVVIALFHSAILFSTLAGVLILASRLTSGMGPGAPSLAAFLGLVAALGGVGGVLGISAYLWATNFLGYHGNEAYAPLHYAHYKNFLRLHIDGDGSLTVYPVGVDRVGVHWRLAPDAPAGAPWYEPDGREPAARLIEPPIRVAGPPG